MKNNAVCPGLVILALASAALALSTVYEKPRTFRASEVLTPSQIEGPHFKVAEAVPTDGYLYVFSVTTDYGPLEAEGKSLLLVRLNEVRALAELDEVSKSQVFLEAAGNSVLNVGKGAVEAVKDPVATVKGLGGGLKRFGTNLGRKAKQATESAASGGEKGGDIGGVANSVLGINAAARKWAQKVGVDPYTTNPILKKALSDIGQIDAAGTIAAKVAVPIPTAVTATATVGNLVWAKDPDALLKENEEKMRALGVIDDVIRKLYQSKGFTLTLHTRLAGALSEVKAKGSADYVAAAAEAVTEREALFFVESAEMLGRFHQRSPVAELLTDSRALVAGTGDGRAAVLLPVDWIQWTKAYEKAVQEGSARAKKELGAAKLEMQLTGRMSETAKKESESLGWEVVELF